MDLGALGDCRQRKIVLMQITANTLYSNQRWWTSLYIGRRRQLAGGIFGTMGLILKSRPCCSSNLLMTPSTSVKLASEIDPFPLAFSSPSFNRRDGFAFGGASNTQKGLKYDT